MLEDKSKTLSIKPIHNY